MLNQNYKISGQLVNKANKPLSNLRIEVWDKDLLFDDFVGESITDSEGRFEIGFSEAYYRELFFDTKPDLYFKIYLEDKTIHSTENTVLWNIDDHQRAIVILVEVEEQTEEPQEQDIRITFFRVHLKSQKQQDDFYRIYKAFDGNWPDIKQELLKDNSFSPELIKKLEFTNQLADWGNNNELLVSLFDREEQTNSMREIALQWNRDEFISRVQNTAPAGYKNKIEYAEKLHEQLFFIEPTAMLINISRDAHVPFLKDNIGKNVISVLERQPDFNIKTTSVYEILKNEEIFNSIPKELKAEVQSQLKIMQRIVAVSPGPVAIPALYNANFHSASQIASLPGEQFVTMMLSAGLARNVANQIQANAQQAVARNEQTLISLKEVQEGTGIEFIDRSLDIYEEEERLFYNEETELVSIKNNPDLKYKKDITVFNFLKQNNLSWDLLFGDADFCECGECTSVYSPASYYVELLQYLRNNNLEPANKNNNVKSIKNTPLEKLFKRRPDLGCLELTCKNTNTILPYVDLVNEVMENFVAHKYTKPFNVEDETSGELLSEPQHTNQDAYFKLSKEVYPLTLPYHQPIDAARIYLNHLGASRHELIDTFYKKPQDHFYDRSRASDAEFLGMTEQEYIILTRESFNRNKYTSQAEYEDKIGVKPVHSYYGYESDSALQGQKGLKHIKDQFLKRTGIDYVNLVELLQTAYINPNIPKGISKAIMESLVNTYSYLLEYARENGFDKMGEVIINQVSDSDWSNWEDGDAPICETSAAERRKILEGDIMNWAENEFPKLGSLIVIESGISDTCNLDNAVLQHLDGSSLSIEEYDRIHRFIRLWHKLGWTIDETDKAIVSLSAKEPDAAFSPEITVYLLNQLVSVKKILKNTGLELPKLLTFWADISTTGENALYHRLFLTHNLVRLDPVFNADASGIFLTADEKIIDHKPVLMAALNLSSEDIDLLLAKLKLDEKLTIQNISKMYRYRLLAKILGFKISELVDFLLLFGDVFESAAFTLKFLETCSRIEDAGFSPSQLNYIIGDLDTEKKPFAPSQKEVLLLTKVLYDGLNAIEATHKDLSEQYPEEEVTIEMVIAKASLLLEPAVVEKIAGVLEGSTTYSTKVSIPDHLLPKYLEITNKLVYNRSLGTIQIKGILTDEEIIKLKNINNNPDWDKAIEEIQKQQNKGYREIFEDNFSIDKEIEKVIKAGDISFPLDGSTAPKKRVAFLSVFLPYLRKELSHRFIMETLAAQTGLEAKLTALLTTKIIKNSSSEFVYNVFAGIKEQYKVQENNWKGYLIPNTTGIYRLIVKNTDQSPNITLDGAIIKFNKQEDSEKEWWNDNLVEVEVELEAGKLHTLSADTAITNIYWKTAASSIVSIPTSALIPDFASADCAGALGKLRKVAILVSTFKLSTDEIRFFNQNKEFGDLDFNKISLNHFLRLEAYTRLRNSLPQTKLNLPDFFNWVNNIPVAIDNEALSIKIGELTGWKKEIIEKLIHKSHFYLVKDDFKNEIKLLKLKQAIEVADKIGMDIDHLFNWTDPLLEENKSEEDTFAHLHEIATSLKNAIRAKYNQTDWEQVIKPPHDLLRNNQKDALIAFLLKQEEFINWKVTDADGLFEYFLIDVQMDAVMETSRIKQAIASVQLFVQRCFLGLEEDHKIPPEKLDRPRWEWMQRYRVWEANRKVFLYPENWIETNLRDDKSPFFKELESELLQKDINKQNVADALKSYLYKIDEVANMEVIGLYIEGEKENKAWGKGAKLHVFSRTKNTPSFFYYRYLSLDEMNWYPWEKMDVDITSYDAKRLYEDELTSKNGCYLIPILYNNRLLVFFPMIVNKAAPVSNKTSIADSAGSTASDLKSKEYHEISMAWSEYRNGKWTQKQISKDPISFFFQDGYELPRINNYKFLPKFVDENTLYIKLFNKNSALIENKKSQYFVFNGTNIQKKYSEDTSMTFSIYYYNYKLDESNYTMNRIYSLQNNYIEVFPYFEKVGDLTNYINTNKQHIKFVHDNTGDLLRKINLPDFEEFFKNNTKDFKFGLYKDSLKSATSKNYHELKDPYSLYNWELFFHTPMALADSLSKAQQFEEAMKWYHYVFNPISNDSFDDKRFWRFSPFKEINSKNILEAIFNQLQPNTSDQSINEWRNKPFMPHVVARSRPVAYMKWVVMKYIDNLIAWGDYLFRQDTIETINQATQLYVMAGHILGPRPMMIPKRGKTKPQTYLSLLNKWDAFGNAMTELELALPFSNQTPLSHDQKNDELANATIFGQAGSLYFCIPKNPKLVAYWDTIGDRLFKIRHSQNIEGVFRKLPLFEPPIDPALLVKAAAQGLSIASVLNDLNTPMPNYRFYYLLQKALELCNELKSFGGALLSAVEKKDNETIARIRSKHENVMNNLMMEIKKKQLEEAQKNLESLKQNRKAPEERMKYYLQLSGMDESFLPDANTDFSGIANTISTVDGESGLKLNAFEKEDMDKASSARDKQSSISHLELLASTLHIIPSVNLKGQPFGIGMGSVVFSGKMIADAAQAYAKWHQIGANTLSYQSTSAAKKGGFSRAMQDRVQQANAAGYELKQIDKQITAQKIRIEIANQEIANQQQLMDNAIEVEEFLKNKFTSEELYTWMSGSLKTLYHQVYGLTYELAKKAEKVYRFERGVSTSNFIQSGYWDAGRNGLLAGEQLYVGLKQMEAAYQNERGYDYEITKHISLKQIDSMALIFLRETGKCEFSIPEVLFDMDYAGQYKRRIKSVSISIPCVAGPYTGVNASLRLLENKFRNAAVGAYEENTEAEDTRFSRFIIPITAIAASSAQNDSGMFELNFKDERYLPFEGAGVISKWRLELPHVHQFNYQTIADVVMHIKYTSSEGGENLKKQANNSVSAKLKMAKEEFTDNGLSVLLNLKQDFPNDWHLFKNNTAISLTIDKTRLPYLVQSFDTIKIASVEFAAKIKEDKNPFSLYINTNPEPAQFTQRSDLMLYVMTVTDILLDTSFQLRLPNEARENLEELFMIVNYVVQ